MLVVNAIIDDADAGRFVEHLVDFGQGDAAAELEIDALAVRAQHGHAHAGDADAEWALEDLRRLLDLS